MAFGKVPAHDGTVQTVARLVVVVEGALVPGESLVVPAGLGVDVAQVSLVDLAAL